MLHSGEKSLVILFALSASCAVLISTYTGQEVDWYGRSVIYGSSAGLLALGCYARVYKGFERLALLAIALSAYVGFSSMIAIVIILRVPIETPLIDAKLFVIDGILGHNWVAFTELIGSFPRLSRLLALIYMSSLTQLALLIVFLALTLRQTRLHRAILACTISLILTAAIWWAFPSIGPAAYDSIDPTVAAQMNLVTDANYARLLNTLATEGVDVIRPGIVGTIAFPSYHTVMALVVVWSLRGLPMFWPALSINVVMLPAMLSHGGHHLVDIPGGVIVFAISVWLACRLVPESDLKV